MVNNNDNPHNKKPKIRLLCFIVLRVLFLATYVITLIFVLHVGYVSFFTDPYRCTLGSEGKIKKDSQEIQIALEQYSNRYGEFPTAEQGLSALLEKPSLQPIPKNYKPILNTKTSILDPWKTPYILKYLPNGEYAIITLGKDKKVGGVGKDSDFNILNEEEYPKGVLK
jgi:type II secretion system protein G